MLTGPQGGFLGGLRPCKSSYKRRYGIDVVFVVSFSISGHDHSYESWVSCCQEFVKQLSISHQLIFDIISHITYST